jgi:hypothetical protein
MHDLFTGGLVPKELYSKEALTNARNILKHDGVLALVHVL